MITVATIISGLCFWAGFNFGKHQEVKKRLDLVGRLLKEVKVEEMEIVLKFNYW